MIKWRVDILLDGSSWLTWWWFLSIDISSWCLNPYRTLPRTLIVRNLPTWFLIDWYPLSYPKAWQFCYIHSSWARDHYLNTHSIREAYLLNDPTPVPWWETIALSPVWHYPFILSISLTIFSCPSSDIWKSFWLP